MSDPQPFLPKRMRTAADEAAAPKYAHCERERRWLVDAAAPPPAVDPIEIHDRYITGTRLRLREMRRDGEIVWKLTRKYECADALARPIVTAYLTRAEYDVLAALPALGVAKQRFRVSEGGRDFSLDRFAGALDGLVLSELEAEDDATLRALADPAWTVRDVSDDPRYQGARLAAHGIPKGYPWPEC
ncbi:hypothetical protein [Sphingomonas sp.]|uniref:hypothetical protein n=1 Tax=Sphingomonas sp. TaxID=28214 RepID=UPI002E2EFE70|nr:hypothetical protein [Sphingomonas sp.]HEX4695163.1 hypothetical protein [Sphingomonas sp.]